MASELSDVAKAALRQLEAKHAVQVGTQPTAEPVTIFYVTWCGFCQKLKQEAAQSGARHALVDVTPHQESPEIVRAQLPGFPISRVGQTWYVGAVPEVKAALRPVAKRRPAPRPYVVPRGSAAGCHHNQGQGHGYTHPLARSGAGRPHPYARSPPSARARSPSPSPSRVGTPRHGGAAAKLLRL